MKGFVPSRLAYTLRSTYRDCNRISCTRPRAQGLCNTVIRLECGIQCPDGRTLLDPNRLVLAVRKSAILSVIQARRSDLPSLTIIHNVSWLDVSMHNASRMDKVQGLLWLFISRIKSISVWGAPSIIETHNV